jgi:cyclopropane fatty-acyl-phospholipid synthase-like methyltransferase
LPADFDVVITPFLFDNFTEDTLPGYFSTSTKALKPGGLGFIPIFSLQANGGSMPC